MDCWFGISSLAKICNRFKRYGFAVTYSQSLICTAQGGGGEL